jgi:hypothetical protein
MKNNDVDNVAVYSYDALGRRISKYNAVADTETRYYYSNNWQVLEERDGDDGLIQWYACGNYIDEVIAKGGSAD